MSSLAEQYIHLFHLKVEEVSEIDHEETISSTIYKLDCKNASFILKICWNNKKFERETGFLKLLKNQYSVPKLIQSTPPVEGRKGAVLMEYIDGEPIQILSEKLAFEMGQCLGKLHRIPVEEKMDPEAQMRQYMYQLLTECQEILSADVLTMCEEYFEKYTHLLTKVDHPCIVHRDFKPGNCLIKEGNIRAIIDWEGAKLSFAEEDFSQMDLLVWQEDDRSKEPFLKGYSSIRPLPKLDAFLPFFRVVKAISVISFTIKRNTWETDHKGIFQKNLDLLKTSLGS